MKFLLLIIVFTTLMSSCDKNKEIRNLEFGSFSLKTPNNWSKFELQGIDSYIGGITNGKDSLVFDFGLYSYSFQYENPELHNYSIDTLNGKIAIIIRPIESGKGILGIYIEKAKGNKRFNLIGSNIGNENVVLDIFKSIRFNDQKSNYISRNFAENYQPHTKMKRIDKLFHSNCGSCHSKNNKYLVGPGLLEMTKLSFDSWMTKNLPLPDSTITIFVAGPTYHQNLGQHLSNDELLSLRKIFQ